MEGRERPSVVPSVARSMSSSSSSSTTSSLVTVRPRPSEMSHRRPISHPFSFHHSFRRFRPSSIHYRDWTHSASKQTSSSSILLLKAFLAHCDVQDSAAVIGIMDGGVIQEEDSLRRLKQSTGPSSPIGGTGCVLRRLSLVAFMQPPLSLFPTNDPEASQKEQ